MATQAQMVANRLNAEKSTGPRTVEGKAVVAQNAVKHGLLAQKAVIVGEDLGEFEFYRGEMLGELAPAGAMESMLAERVVSLSWRLRRAERVQNEAFDSLLAKDIASPLARLTQSLMPKGPDRPGGDFGSGQDDLALGRVVVKDFAGGRVLDRLLMYERRIEHSLFRTMTELQRLRLMRELDPPTENPTRQGECWGKPQPTTPTPAMEKPMRQSECWGKPQPTDTSRAVGKPTRQGERWGKAQSATATEKTASDRACPDCDDLPRETKPMAGERETEDSVRSERAVRYAKQSQSAGAAGRERGADFVRKTAVQGQWASFGGAESCLAEGSRPAETGAGVSGGNG